ncbi:MAG: large conductance mechanosensitive channel protein MscL [Clostridia bacterium]|nr:large conductance mechanosensitive channel protein MscL [Clostridia bacterium]
MKFFDEFKEFIAKGNAVDMAVGVVVGGAFTAIVNSLVQDVINPSIALITKIFKTEAASVTGGASDSLLSMTNWIIPGTDIKIGSFLGAVINFLLIAFVIFCVVKAINTMRDKVSKKVDIPETDPPAPTQEELLAEIRDLLKDKN